MSAFIKQNKKTFPGHPQNPFQISPLSEGRMVYFSRKNSAEYEFETDQFPDQAAFTEPVMLDRIKELKQLAQKEGTESARHSKIRKKIQRALDKESGDPHNESDRDKLKRCEDYVRQLDRTIVDRETFDAELQKVSAEGGFIEDMDFLDMQTTVSEIGNFDEMLDRLHSDKLDQADIDYFLRSDVGAFFDNDLREKLKTTQYQMQISDKAFTSIMENVDSKHISRAEEEWPEERRRTKKEDIPDLNFRIKEKKAQIKAFKKEANAQFKATGVKHPEMTRYEYELEDLKNQKSLLQKKLKNKSGWINRRAIRFQAEENVKQKNSDLLGDVNNGKAEADWEELNKDKKFVSPAQREEAKQKYVDRIVKQMENDDHLEDANGRPSAAVHRAMRELEEQGSVDVSIKLEEGNRAEIYNYMMEARKRRLEQVNLHLRERYDKCRSAYEENKHLFTEREGASNLTMFFKQAESWFTRVRDTKDIKKIEKWIEQTEMTIFGDAKNGLTGSIDEMNALFNDPEKLKAALTEQSKELKDLVAIVQSKRPDHGNNRELCQQSRVLLGQLSNIDSIPLEGRQKAYRELQSLLDSLDKENSDLLNAIDDKITDPDAHEAAQKAHVALQELKKQTITDVNQMEAFLIQHIGKDHVQVVDQHAFTHYKRDPGDPNEEEKNLEKYTEGGMVFYQRGNEWRIVMNRNTDAKNLQEQVSHELGHVEYEGIKGRVESLLMDTDPQHWWNIKAAFVKRANAEGKAPPHGKKKWTVEDDHDIAHEVYSMYKDGDTNLDTGSSDELTKLIAASEGMKQLRGARSDIFKDEEEELDKAEEEIRGFMSVTSGGVDENAGDSGTSEGMPEGAGSAKDYEGQIEFIENDIKELQKSEFLGSIPKASAILKEVKKASDNTKALNNRFKDKPNVSVLGIQIKSQIAVCKDSLETVRAVISKVSAKTPNKVINPFQDLWNRSIFLSLDDMVQVGIDVKEFFERRHERKKADHAARLGEALFNGTDMGREALARRQKAEKQEVQEWQDRYDNMDSWELEDELRSLSKSIDPSPDQLKAILRLLAQKGRVDWRMPELWETLNKLQSAVHLTPGDSVLLHDPSLMRQKLHMAMGHIWDFDEYTSLQRQNEDTYESETKKWMPSYDRMQDQLTSRLDEMLQLFRDGEHVEPMEYESILVYSIEKGKSFAENVLFHLMAGMAYGLLTPDRGLALDRYLNQWPATQWIYSKSPPLSQADYVHYCETYFPNDFKNGTISNSNKVKDGYTVGSEFKNFYWVHVQNDEMTQQRVRKSVSERVWDHDWTRSIACIGDANTAKRYFSGRSGQQQAQDTGVQNAYVGAIQWLEENADNYTSINYRQQFARQAGWLAMSEGIMDYVAYYRGDTDINSRANASMENSKAREAGVGNHGDWTLGQHRNKAKGFLDMIDPNFFRMLRNEKLAATKDGKEKLGQEAKDYLMAHYAHTPKLVEEWDSITSIDQVYNKMDLIIQTMMSEHYMSDGRLRGIIAKQRANAQVSVDNG